MSDIVTQSSSKKSFYQAYPSIHLHLGPDSKSDLDSDNFTFILHIIFKKYILYISVL